jgi:alpha-ketoglutarate-dependent taurine dioxygenase
VEIRPLEPVAPFGARVVGLDPGRELSDAEQHALRAALDEHHLLIAYLPGLTPEGQQRIASVFGPIVDESGKGDGWTLVSDRPGGVINEGPLLFHSDLAFTPTPLTALSLYALEVPAGGTATHFADGTRAATHLPPDLRASAAGHTALHVFPLTNSRGDERYRIATLDPGAPRAEHPVLWDHPRTGAPTVYVSAMQTDSIVGLPERESEALLVALWDRLYEPGNVYTHRWEVGDLVVWDNVSVQHARDDVKPGDGRTLRRVPVGAIAVKLRPTPDVGPEPGA